MYAFAKSMAFFWTLAEALILIYVRWAYRFMQGRSRGQPLLPGGVLAALGLAAALLFGGEALLGRVLSLDEPVNRKVYRWGLWHLFCTLWVLLEGIIMIYVVRIYRLLAPGLGPGRAPRPAGRPFRGRPPAMALLVLFFCGLYGLYDYHMIQLLLKGHIQAAGFHRLCLFYIRLCGVFWILFEWVVALVGLRTYATLKRLGGTR